MYATVYMYKLITFLAIMSFPQLLKHETDMVASCHVASTLLTTLLCLGSYEQCCTQLLKVLHTCCNTDVLGVLLIYPPSPLGTVHIQELCIYVSQTLFCSVTIYCINVSLAIEHI